MPPCGSPLMRITNSVPRPVSELNASSEMISEDLGDTISVTRSSMSWGMTTRSSAALAPGRSVEICSTRPSGTPGRCKSGLPPSGYRPTNETTLHCMTPLPASSIAVKTCVPIGRSGSSMRGPLRLGCAGAGLENSYRYSVPDLLFGSRFQSPKETGASDRNIGDKLRRLLAKLTSGRIKCLSDPPSHLRRGHQAPRRTAPEISSTCLSRMTSRPPKKLHCNGPCGSTGSRARKVRA
jgi:hypothetical protein